MPTSLLDGLNGLLAPDLISSAARNLGAADGSVRSGLAAAFPSILAGLAGKAGNTQAMEPLFDLISSSTNDDSVIRHPALAADATSPDSPLGPLAGTFISSLFGSQLSSVGEVVGRSAGVGSALGSSLLRVAAPLVLAFLGKRITSGGLNLAGFSQLLLGERNQIMRAAPAGLASALGMDGAGLPDTGTATPRVSTTRVSGNPRWLWPALAALALVAVVWALSRTRQPAATDQTVGALSGGTVTDSVEPAVSDDALPTDVVDATWEWVGFVSPVEQLQIDGPSRYTISFGADGRVAVKADCNRGTAGYSVTADRRIAFQPIALTRAACAPGSLSDRYARELGRATSYFIKDGDLFLSLPVDSGTLQFRRQP